jgi:pimeloyl-ACP methyl ester carboxylesterase
MVAAMESKRVIPAGGVDFHVCQRGQNPRMVFLHGFGADLCTWGGLWRAMGDTPSALRYDLRGFGQTACREQGDFSHSDDLLCLLDTAGIDSVDLVGVSMGGGIALNFSLDHPQRVRNLVLISPAIVAWEWSDDWQALWRPIVECARAGALDEARRMWWQHPLFASTRNSEGETELYESIMRFPGDQWVRDNQRSGLPDVDRIHLLRARTLLLTGARDMADFRLIADLLEASADNLQRIDHAELGHLLHLEDAAACARSIQSFLRAEPGT